MSARYQEIAATLRSEIETQVWAVGAKLPSEAELISRFDASRTTVRQALKELRDARLVQMRHGVGVFVAPPHVVQRLDSRERLSKARRERNTAAFLAEAQAQQFTPSSAVRIWFEPAGDFGELLNIDAEDELCVRDRVMRADGAPVMLAISRLPREITRTTRLEEVDTGPGGVHARLEELGYELTGHEEVVGTRPAEPRERELLDLGDEWVLTVRRRTYSHERVVEVNDMALRGGSYELRYAWDAN